MSKFDVQPIKVSKWNGKQNVTWKEFKEQVDKLIKEQELDENIILDYITVEEPDCGMRIYKEKIYLECNHSLRIEDIEG